MQDFIPALDTKSYVLTPPTPPREQPKNEYDIIRNKLQEMFQEIKVSMSDLSVAKSSAQDKLNVRKLTESTFPS